MVLALGHQARLAVGDTLGGGTAMEFVSCGIQKKETLVHRTGIRGSRAIPADGVRKGTYTVGGPLVLQPSASELAAWWPRILGGSGGVLAETLPEFCVMLNAVTKTHAWSGCVVNKATLRCTKGGILELTIDVEGRTEEATYSWPGGLTATVHQPYLMFDLVLTLGGASRECEAIEVTVDNQLILDRFVNSQVRTALPPGDDRLITVKPALPYSSDNVGLYGQGVEGAAGTAAWTNGSDHTTLSFTNLKLAATSPAVPDKKEVLWTPDFQAFAVNGVEMTVS